MLQSHQLEPLRTSGNGFAPATPEWQSDDQDYSHSLAATILEDTPSSEPPLTLPGDSQREELVGGGGVTHRTLVMTLRVLSKLREESHRFTVKNS